MYVAIQIQGQKHILEVIVNPHFRHPLILGTNWLDFSQLLGYLCADVSWENAELGGEAVTQVGEAEKRQTGPDPEEQSLAERPTLTKCDDFHQEHSRDETLKNAFEQV